MPDETPTSPPAPQPDLMELAPEARLWLLLDRATRLVESMTPVYQSALEAQTERDRATTSRADAVTGLLKVSWVQMGLGLGIAALLIGATSWLFRWDPTPLIDRAFGECPEAIVAPAASVAPPMESEP